MGKIKNFEDQNTYFSEQDKFNPEQENFLDEPWVRLHNGIDLQHWNKEDEISWNQSHRQREKYKFYINYYLRPIHRIF